MMLQNGSGYGFGDGTGFGDGYGDGYGFCDGNGSGYGDGYGDGYGNGIGDSDGDGDGDGYGVLPPQYGITALSLPWAVLNASVERNYRRNSHAAVTKTISITPAANTLLHRKQTT